MDIREIFNEFASEYDKTRRNFIPCFDDFYGTAINLIPFSPNDSFNVIDLGAGTGLLSQFIIESFPNAKITLIDIADQMLKQAQNRLQKYGTQMSYEVMDYSGNLSSKLSEKYDLIMSALSIHHLTAEEKQNLFINIFTVLKKGGFFINADQALGETPEIEVKYKQDWWKRIKKTSLTDKDLEAAKERIKADKMDTLFDQLLWLKRAAFTNVNCWYSNYSFCVYSGQKPS